MLKMKAHHYTNLVEGGRTIQGDVLIVEIALNEIARLNVHENRMLTQN